MVILLYQLEIKLHSLNRGCRFLC